MYKHFSGLFSGQKTASFGLHLPSSAGKIVFGIFSALRARGIIAWLEKTPLGLSSLRRRCPQGVPQNEQETLGQHQFPGGQIRMLPGRIAGVFRA